MDAIQVEQNFISEEIDFLDAELDFIECFIMNLEYENVYASARLHQIKYRIQNLHNRLNELDLV